MSQHPSLKVDSVGVKHRNVLKRFERVKKMKNAEVWTDETSIYNLPKYKSIKLKVKKGGRKEKEEDKDKDKGKKGK
jgi:small basic protein (TIGR04137 family)